MVPHLVGVVAIMMIQTSNVIMMPLLLARVNPTAAVAAHLLIPVADMVLDMTVDAPMAQTIAGDLVDLPLRAATIATGALLPPVVAPHLPLAGTVMDHHHMVAAVEVLLMTVTVVTALMHHLVVHTVVLLILTVDMVAVVVDLLPNHPVTATFPLPVDVTTHIMDLR